jgi:hypothetical protein
MITTAWVPGTFPVPFFQTWCCKSSAVTTSNDCKELLNAGLMPKMLECVKDNLVLNNVGIDCVHYLFNDDACRDFLSVTFPTDVVNAYDSLIPTAFKADLWRYCILYMFGGVYMDIKYKWIGAMGGDGGDGGDGGGVITIRDLVNQMSSSHNTFGYNTDNILVLERDAPDLWPQGHFGIHNAFMISKPKNPLFFKCIQHIVSYSKTKLMLPSHLSSLWSSGCVTLPLFVTGPGLLGDVWRSRMMFRGCDLLDNYVSMVSHFRVFFQGDGVIGYLYKDDSYNTLLKVYDSYIHDYNNTARTNVVEHYTLLWSRGIVWKKTEE